MDNGLMEFSPSVTTDVTWSKSWLSRSFLGVPLLHSLILYITTLNLQSLWACSTLSALLGRVFLLQGTVVN